MGRFTITNNPSCLTGAALNGSTGLLTGKPNRTGTCVLKFTVTYNGIASDEAAVTITVP